MKSICISDDTSVSHFIFSVGVIGLYISGGHRYSKHFEGGSLILRFCSEKRDSNQEYS